MRVLQRLVAPLLLLAILLTPAFGTVAFADPTKAAISSVCSSINGVDSTGQPKKCDDAAAGPVKSIVTLVINILSFLIGFVAIIMIIYNGFRFVTSSGEASKVASARSGILYAIVGLVVAALAQILVHFVLFQVDHAQAPSTSAKTKKK